MDNVRTISSLLLCLLVDYRVECENFCLDLTVLIVIYLFMMVVSAMDHGCDQQIYLSTCDVWSCLHLCISYGLKLFSDWLLGSNMSNRHIEYSIKFI